MALQPFVNIGGTELSSQNILSASGVLSKLKWWSTWSCADHVLLMPFVLNWQLVLVS